MNVNISCLPKMKYGSDDSKYLYLCKWEYNGLDFSDTLTTAKYDCSNSLNLKGLFGTYSSRIRGSDTNMTNMYLISGSCGRLF